MGISSGRVHKIAVPIGIGAAILTSSLGLLLPEASIRVGPGMGGDDVLRLAHVLLLIVGLTYSTFRYAGKHHSQLDELALLVFLTCGINLVVQLTGGARSYWQGLYLVLGGLSSLAFSRKIVVFLVALVLCLETSNWLIAAEASPVDLFRLAGLFLLAVVGYGYMARAERERAERAEDRLLRLDTGLRQLGGSDLEEDAVSPLSEEAQQAGRAEQLQRLESYLEPLVQLAAKATKARAATLLQVAEGEKSYWARLSTEGASKVESKRFDLRGSFLSAVLQTEQPVSLASATKPHRLPWWREPALVQSVLAIPIRIWDEPPLILTLEHERPGHFDENRRELAVAIAAQISEAQTLFRRQAQHYVEELELKGLLGASEKLSSAAHVVDLLRHIVDYARGVGRFDTCAVCLLAEGNEAFSVVVAEGYRKELLGKSFPLESSSWASWVLRAREEPLAIRMERRTGMPILDPKERATTATNFLAVPLRAQQRVCGALLLTRNGEPFTARELRLLRIYCNQAAVAMENAIVYERVENLAATDALTGLFNRRYLDGALERELARASRSESSLALLMLDIDHFKSVNDTYGHAVGDLILKKVAATLSGRLRQADVLARFGGEEFVVLLPQVTAAAALDSAERIRASVERTRFHAGGKRTHVTVSIGLAMFPDQSDAPESLLEAADQALYQAKKLGRNRVCCSGQVEAET
ncbi:MAG: diguanylate cyclase [Acidobacteria bacterium]|nr:MAG: diguanylate cyclase [Acidobacteriota bacterium]